MTSKEFVQWLKGFTEGVHEYAITPKQWDLLKERLNEVSDEPKTLNPSPYPIGVPIDSPFITPSPVDPYNPYKITCTPGTTIRTTPGTGYITVANPNIALFGTGSYNSSTSTQANWYPTGSNVTYTTNGGPTWYSSNIIENDSREK